MFEKDFNKEIEALREVKMTEGEKASILRGILSLPMRSPYWHKSKILVFAHIYRTQTILAVCLVFMLSFGGAVYASSGAVPGELLYPVKVKIVEPVLDVVNNSQEKKAAWQEEKVVRRIEEARILADQDKLDDKKLAELDKRIKKNSEEFVKVVEKEDEGEDLKEALREKIKEEKDIKKEIKKEDDDEKKEYNKEGEERKEKTEEAKLKKENKEVEKKEKINKLKDSALKVLDQKAEGKKAEKENSKKSKERK